jgi:DNA-binding CsgD family transcriptional regulator
MLARGSIESPRTEFPLGNTTTRLNCLASALEDISEGVVLLNAEGQLIWHNRAFDKLLVENREGHLLVAAVIDFAADCIRDAKENRDSAHESGDSVSRAVTVGRIEHELQCTLMPTGMLGSESYTLCLIKRSASRWSSYQEHLRQTWGLTEREAQVAVECLRGNKNLEIADHLRISVETVNKHLDKVYQKANVRGRAELASRLLDSGL